MAFGNGGAGRIRQPITNLAQAVRDGTRQAQRTLSTSIRNISVDLAGVNLQRSSLEQLVQQGAIGLASEEIRGEIFCDGPLTTSIDGLRRAYQQAEHHSSVSGGLSNIQRVNLEHLEGLNSILVDIERADQNGELSSVQQRAFTRLCDDAIKLAGKLGQRDGRRGESVGLGDGRVLALGDRVHLLWQQLNPGSISRVEDCAQAVAIQLCSLVTDFEDSMVSNGMNEYGRQRQPTFLSEVQYRRNISALPQLIARRTDAARETERGRDPSVREHAREAFRRTLPDFPDGPGGSGDGGRSQYLEHHAFGVQGDFTANSNSGIIGNNNTIIINVPTDGNVPQNIPDIVETALRGRTSGGQQTGSSQTDPNNPSSGDPSGNVNDPSSRSSTPDPDDNDSNGIFGRTGYFNLDSEEYNPDNQADNYGPDPRLEHNQLEGNGENDPLNTNDDNNLDNQSVSSDSDNSVQDDEDENPFEDLDIGTLHGDTASLPVPVTSDISPAGEPDDEEDDSDGFIIPLPSAPPSPSQTDLRGLLEKIKQERDTRSAEDVDGEVRRTGSFSAGRASSPTPAGGPIRYRSSINISLAGNARAGEIVTGASTTQQTTGDPSNQPPSGQPVTDPNANQQGQQAVGSQSAGSQSLAAGGNSPPPPPPPSSILNRVPQDLVVEQEQQNVTPLLPINAVAQSLENSATGALEYYHSLTTLLPNTRSTYILKPEYRYLYPGIRLDAVAPTDASAAQATPQVTPRSGMDRSRLVALLRQYDEDNNTIVIRASGRQSIGEASTLPFADVQGAAASNENVDIYLRRGLPRTEAEFLAIWGAYLNTLPSGDGSPIIRYSVSQQVLRQLAPSLSASDANAYLQPRPWQMLARDLAFILSPPASFIVSVVPTGTATPSLPFTTTVNLLTPSQIQILQQRYQNYINVDAQSTSASLQPYDLGHAALDQMGMFADQGNQFFFNITRFANIGVSYALPTLLHLLAAAEGLDLSDGNVQVSAAKPPQTKIQFSPRKAGGAEAAADQPSTSQIVSPFGFNYREMVAAYGPVDVQIQPEFQSLYPNLLQPMPRTALMNAMSQVDSNRDPGSLGVRSRTASGAPTYYVVHNGRRVSIPSLHN